MAVLSASNPLEDPSADRCSYPAIAAAPHRWVPDPKPPARNQPGDEHQLRRTIPMRPSLPPGPHVPYEARSVFKGRQLDPSRPFLRLNHARQLKAEIMLLGLRHSPILRHRNASKRHHTHFTELTATSTGQLKRSLIQNTLLQIASAIEQTTGEMDPCDAALAFGSMPQMQTFLSGEP
jgi:hypothetical protein